MAHTSRVRRCTRPRAFAHKHAGAPRLRLVLLVTPEEWARSQGARELASDTWIDNEPSQRAHEALGFEVVDRCVHFRKSLM